MVRLVCVDFFDGVYEDEVVVDTPFILGYAKEPVFDLVLSTACGVQSNPKTQTYLGAYVRGAADGEEAAIVHTRKGCWRGWAPPWCGH